MAARSVAARPIGGAAGCGAADGGTVGGWKRGGLAARSVVVQWMAGRSVVVQRMAARLVAHAAVIAAAAAVVRALAVLHALKGQWPPAGGRNGSRIAMCRAHSHAVPHSRTFDQHQQQQCSLRWM